MYISAFFFVCSILTLVILGLRKPQGYLHPPFFINVVILLFYVPQVVSFSNHSVSLSIEFFLFLLVTFISAVSVYKGFYSSTRIGVIPLDQNRRQGVLSSYVFIILTFFLLLIFYSFIKIINLSGGLTNYLFSSYDILVWEGEAVRLNFFIQLIYILIPILLVLYNIHGKKYLYVMILLSLIIPFLYIVFLNRRLEFFTIGLSFYFYYFLLKGKRMKRSYLIIGGFLSLFVINIFPYLRASDSTLESALANGREKGIIINSEHNEIKNGVLLVSVSVSNLSFNYGLGIVKQVFKDFIPSSVIGRDLKNSILGNDSMRILVYEKTSFEIPSNEFVTGIAWVFYELGLLFFMFWYLIGFYSRKLWNRLILYPHSKNFVLYISFFPVVLTSLVYSAGVGLGMFIKLIIFLEIIFFKKRYVKKIL